MGKDNSNTRQGPGYTLNWGNRDGGHWWNVFDSSGNLIQDKRDKTEWNGDHVEHHVIDQSKPKGDPDRKKGGWSWWP